MAAPWPATLPDYFLVDNFQRLGPSNTVRAETLSGRFKVRRISTKQHRVIEGSMALSQSQVADFETFYRTTLKDGSLPFQGLNNPLTNADTVWMFLEDPTQSPYQNASNVFTLSLKLLALPDAPA